MIEQRFEGLEARIRVRRRRVRHCLIAAFAGALAGCGSWAEHPQRPVRPPRGEFACSRLPPPSEFIRVNLELERLYQTDFSRFQQALTAFTTRYNNLGSTLVGFSAGAKTVFRSSILAGNPQCLEWLVKSQGVTTIVNLYSGDLIKERELALEEEAEFERLGGQHYLHALNLADGPKRGQTLEQIQDRLSGIVRMIAATPGNVLVHCVGGIHRTGEIYGILEKCVNRLPLDVVIDHYVRHAGGVVAGNPEYRSANVEILKSFDCARLD